MNKKELVKKLKVNKDEAIATYLSELKSAFDRLDEQYAKDMAGIDKPLKWPLVRVGKGHYYSFIGDIVKVSHDRSLSECIDRGDYYNSYEEARLHDKRNLAEIQVTRRIAEINQEEEWEADWDYNTGGGQLKFCVNMPPQAYLDVLYIAHSRSHPPHWYGCEKAIRTVIKEMPESCKVMLGVEND